MKKKILFYMQVPFIDINVEIINRIKKDNEVHVLIELPASQLKANVFNIEINLTDYDTIIPYSEVAETWKIQYLDSYFSSCASVNFASYKPGDKKGFIKATRSIIKFINRLNPDCMHFDDFSARQAFILPFIKSKKPFVLNIHDPKPHMGEFEWKRFIIRKLFRPLVTTYLTFSNSSKSELAENLKPGSNIKIFSLLPYTIFQKFDVSQEQVEEKDRTMLFFGRLSPYKGIDLLIDAIAEVVKVFPDQKFLICGRPTFGYKANFERLGAAAKAVTIIERHLTGTEIATMISRSKLVICPYLEATQSGVVMTAYALNCPVLVTNTGGLIESVIDNVTGLITEEISADGLTTKMLEFLREGLYEKISKNLIHNPYSINAEKTNLEVIKEIYV